MGEIKADKYPEKDFNKLVEKGIYSYSGTPETLKLINCPGINTGTLIIDRIGTIDIQIWHEHINDIYVRSKYRSSSGYTQWKKIV